MPGYCGPRHGLVARLALTRQLDQRGEPPRTTPGGGDSEDATATAGREYEQAQDCQQGREAEPLGGGGAESWELGGPWAALGSRG